MRNLLHHASSQTATAARSPTSGSIGGNRDQPDPTCRSSHVGSSKASALGARQHCTRPSAGTRGGRRPVGAGGAVVRGFVRGGILRGVVEGVVWVFLGGGRNPGSRSTRWDGPLEIAEESLSCPRVRIRELGRIEDLQNHGKTRGVNHLGDPKTKRRVLPI